MRIANGRVTMRNTPEIHYNIEDALAHEDIEAIADTNAENFYNLKRDLVQKRQRLCSLDELAKQLKEPVEEVAEFEQYYSDPTVSQLQEYALAVMCIININAEDFSPDRSSMYRHLSVSVKNDFLELKNSNETSSVQIREESEKV